MKLIFAALALTLLLSVEAQQCGNQEIEDWCVDKTLPNGEAWYDSGGGVAGYPQPNCEFYGAWDDRCESEGHLHAHFGMTACQACCVCGGGETKQMGPDVCLSDMNWKVRSNGGEYDCSYFDSNPEKRCTGSLGSKLAWSGSTQTLRSANDACCECKRLLPPTEAPLPDICMSDMNWKVRSNGGEYDCSYFDSNPEKRCTGSLGSKKAWSGSTQTRRDANDACCECKRLPTPTREPTPFPTKGCISDPDWFIMYDGLKYTCEEDFDEWIDLCTDEPGFILKNGMTAKQACCGCENVVGPW